MKNLKNIQSLASFKRNTVELVEQLKQTKSPLVLTVNGKAELVVIGAEEYEEMLQKIEQAESIKAIRHGIDAFKKGEFRPAREALDQLGKKNENHKA